MTDLQTVYEKAVAAYQIDPTAENKQVYEDAASQLDQARRNLRMGLRRTARGAATNEIVASVLGVTVTAEQQAAGQKLPAGQD